MMKTFFVALLLWSIASEATHIKDMRLVNAAVMGIYEKPTKASVFASQKVYGRLIEVIESVNQEWVKVVTWDGVVGYAQTKKLIADNSAWRTSSTLQRVKSLVGFVYPTPTFVNYAIIKLPYNAYIKVIEGTTGENWAKVELIDGSFGWIMTDDIEPITILSREEILQRAEMFVGLPYIWGGTSSFGFDCSGFTQTMACQMGYPMKRFAREQAADPIFEHIAFEDIQPGDFVYFGKEQVTHTALCIQPGKIIHAAVIGNKPRLAIADITHQQLHFRGARRIPVAYYDDVTHCY